MNSTEQFYTVDGGTIVAGPYSRPKNYGSASSDERLAQDGVYRLWVEPAGEAPGKYYTEERGEPVVDGITVTRTDYWEAIPEVSVRGLLKESISASRQAANRQQIDLAADPALAGIMAEANAAATARTNALNMIPAGDMAALEDFDTTLDASEVGAVQTAATLYAQELALSDDPSISPSQGDELAVSASAHQAIVQAGDNSVEVPEPPVFARRLLGIPGEDYGTLEIVRVVSPTNPAHWTLTFRLTFDRKLDLAGHWIASYDETAPLDVIPGSTGYRTTAQLTEVSPRVYEADAQAVADWGPEQVERRVTLCNGHITNPVLPLMVIPASSNAELFRVRYGGNVVQGPTGTEWVDSGQTATYAQNSIIRVASTADIPEGAQIQVGGLEYAVTGKSSIDLTVDPPTAPGSLAGETVFIWA